MKSASPRTRRKAKVGTVTVRNSNNRLQLVFTHLGKRHFVSLGLAHSPLNMRKAQEIAFEVQRDIEYGEFDKHLPEIPLPQQSLPQMPRPQAYALS